MSDWMPVGDGFIEADVIRWKEPVFKNRRRGRPARLGERLVTAEVLHDDGGSGWVDLLVRHSEVVSAHYGWNVSDVYLPAKDIETKRRRSTIIKGNAERLPWSDESARVSVIASRFPGSPNSAPSVPADPEESYSLRSCFNPVSRLNKSQPGKAGWERAYSQE